MFPPTPRLWAHLHSCLSVVLALTSSACACVFAAYGISLAISFLIKDPLVAALIAVLPVRSSGSNKALGPVLSALAKLAAGLVA